MHRQLIHQLHDQRDRRVSASQCTARFLPTHLSICRNLSLVTSFPISRQTPTITLQPGASPQGENIRTHVMPLTKDETRLVANLCKQTLKNRVEQTHTHCQGRKRSEPEIFAASHCKIEPERKRLWYNDPHPSRPNARTHRTAAKPRAALKKTRQSPTELLSDPAHRVKIVMPYMI